MEGFFSSRGVTEECAMFKVVDDQEDCLPANFDKKVAVECQEYVYDASVFEETLATKLDLVCGREGLQKLLGTFVMFGLLVGSLFGEVCNLVNSSQIFCPSYQKLDFNSIFSSQKSLFLTHTGRPMSS